MQIKYSIDGAHISFTSKALFGEMFSVRNQKANFPLSKQKIAEILRSLPF